MKIIDQKDRIIYFDVLLLMVMVAIVGIALAIALATKILQWGLS